MHLEVLHSFSSILNTHSQSWQSILEVGPSHLVNESLLFLPSTIKAPRRIGIDLTGPYQVGNVSVLKEDAKALSFQNNYFDLVLCNSVLEHEPQFWKVLDELKRVLMPNGILMIGVPGFSADKKHQAGIHGTSVLSFHSYPNDYYRFSSETMREVFLSDLKDINMVEVMSPPRIIGWGKK